MCGRFVSSNNPERIAAYFDAVLDAASDAAPLEPSWNVAPTNEVYGVVAATPNDRGDATDRHVRTYQWGLVPSWAKDAKIGSRMINARSETIAEKPAFRTLLTRKRLVIPMDGFYEWRAMPGTKSKQPYFIRRRDGELLAAAGLWSAWCDPARRDDPDAPWLHTCTVVTTEANATVAPVHDRMPAFLPHDAWEAWLDPSLTDAAVLRSLLRPAPAELLQLIPVSTQVNSVRNKGRELIEPISLST